MCIRDRRTIGARAYWLLTVLVHLVPLAAMAWILSANLDAATAWQLWGGFAAGGVLELYSQWRERDLLALEDLPDDTDPQTAAQMAADLREVNAFDAFQRMHTLVLIALQLTLVMVYTFIGLSTQELLVCMLLAVACTVIMREVSLLCLRLVKRPFDTQLLLVGLFLWLYGLILLYRQLDSRPELLMSALAVALCTSGLAVSVTALAELERDGLVYSQRTAGRFVTEDQIMIDQVKRDLAQRHIQAFWEAMTHLGYDREEILTLLRQEESKGGEDNGSSGV